jgi:2-aminoadipate transaminase
MQQDGSRLDPWISRYAARASSMTASEIRSLFAVASRPEVVSLAGGMPYVQALPLDQMADSLAAMIRTRGATALQYGSGQGDPFLREQILEVMAEVGISANADDIVVTTGSQMALDLVVRVFCDPGDVVLVESPSYVGALGVFRAYECEVVHVPMDEIGLDPVALEEVVKKLEKEGKKIKLLYTIPSYHNPAGITQTPERRQQVLEVARRHQLAVLEDDPYGLLGFDGLVPRAMRADEHNQVLYLGSFSKTIASGLRVGWVLAPHGVREKLVLAAESAVLCPSNFAQLAVSDYLQNQPWREQIAVFRDTYKQRRDALLDTMKLLMPAGTKWTVPTGGFYSWVTLPEGIDSRAMLPRAVTSLVAYVPGTGFYVNGQGKGELRLSYCYPTPERIVEGVRRLAGVVEQELDLLATFGPDAMPQTEMPNFANTPAPNVR